MRIVDEFEKTIFFCHGSESCLCKNQKIKVSNLKRDCIVTSKPRTMFISSRCKGGLFCLLSFVLFAISSGQLVDESKNGQNNKINSIKVNKIVTSDSVEQPADSDRIVLGNRNVNLNSKYVTQSAVTSGPSVGLYMGPKKSEYEPGKKCARHSNWHQLTSIVLAPNSKLSAALLTCLEAIESSAGLTASNWT